MAYRVELFVPFSEIDRENTTPSSGSILVTQCLNEFDPVDLSGISNYGAGTEPGFNGTLMPDGSKSNNCSGPLSLEIRALGSVGIYAASTATNNGNITYQPLISTYHSGDGIVEPGMAYVERTQYRNQGSVDLEEVEVCTVFDNTTQVLTESSNVGTSLSGYAYIGSAAGAVPENWKIEYASAPVVGVDPLDGDGDGIPDLNPVTGRYEGQWTNLRSQPCDQAGLVWSTDPLAIGLDNINMVKASAASPGGLLETGTDLYLLVPLQASAV